MTDANTHTGAGRRAQGLDVMDTLSGSSGGGAVRADQLIGELGALGTYVVDHAFGAVWARPGLSRRDRSLIVVAMVAALGGQNPQLAAHVRGALNHGLKPDEIREIAVHLCGYAGFPRAIEAMRVMNNTIAQELGDKAPPPTAAGVKDEAARRADGTEVFQRLTGTLGTLDPEAAAQSLEDDLSALGHAAINWGFGELWTREQLSLRDRSLLIVAVLSTLGRTEQLTFHVPGALNHGVTPEELEEVVLMVSIYAGFPFAASAIKMVHEHTKTA